MQPKKILKSLGPALLTGNLHLLLCVGRHWLLPAWEACNQAPLGLFSQTPAAMADDALAHLQESTPAQTPSSEAKPVERAALYIVPTPIGNLGDISVRAARVLAAADLIACEDTRVTAKLLHHLGISKPMMSYREETEQREAPKLAARVAAGDLIALVSDAGTPTLSDPGFRLVRECKRLGLKVIGLPGPMAAITALSISGLPTNAFFYTGFLPPKSHGRRKLFENYRALEATLIAYESCHRIDKTFEDIEAVLGPNRYVALARELTKIHEECLTGTVSTIKPLLIGSRLKGECVVLVAPEGYQL